ncbi:vacuolar protein sorting-associated protein 35, partial [Kipferlia bialata]|eukprot:g15841.t1
MLTRQRKDLQGLVGGNFERLAHLNGITAEHYRDIVLPSLGEQVLACNDGLAQDYLLHCVVAAFPDHFHVGALTPFLSILGSTDAK